MPGKGERETGSAGEASGRTGDRWRRLTRWQHASGKTISRRLERRFNTVLDEIARGDPATLVELPHARWLLDNSHLVRQALQQIETDLPRAYYRQLCAVVDGNAATAPRIFTLVDEVLDHTGLPIDCQALAQCCREHRADHPTSRLTLGELWAVPTALRILLVTRLCHAAEQAERATADVAIADAETATVAGCITSLRTVATYNWPDFVEQGSAVEHTLKGDPSAHYHLMDFATRDHYRAAVEKIALRTDAEQWQVAQAALQLARASAQASCPLYQRHVGYYLVDEGRPQLERAVNFRATVAMRLKRWLAHQRTASYLLPIIALAVAGAALLIAGLRAHGAPPVTALLMGLIALVPLLSVSSGAVNFVISLILPPRHLAKLDFAAGLTAGHRGIVVVPMLLSSARDIADNLKTLEQNYLGNADPRLSFALLSDFTDAADEHTPADQALLDQAVEGIDTLNARYGDSDGAPFLLFHRRRTWNERAQCWMGWERKRGKLEEFNELLRGRHDTNYALQRGRIPAKYAQVQYVITLDADSYMPTGAARSLVGTMAHPLNRPVFDRDSGRVTRGYTVIQPRLETNPVTGADSLFARIFAGDVTLDLYSHAVSDVYQDVFGEAVFAGKGIYHLDSFRRSVSNRVPENQILSHDLLEGLLGRAGLASDIMLLENYPTNYLAYLRRLHRWVRGDWQLLRWLYRRRLDGDHDFAPGVIGRWKLFDNLRRSLFSPAILLLLIIGWIWLPVNPLAWTLLFALFPGLPILLRLTLALRTGLWRWGTVKSSLSNLLGHAGADFARWLLALVFLPAEAYMVTGAVARTLYRVVVSQRNLLEWTTAAQVSHFTGQAHTVARFWATLWFGPATAVVVAAAVVMFNPLAVPAAAVFVLAWLVSPAIALYLSRPVTEQPPVVLAEQEKILLRGIARDTWRFFERFIGIDTHWLPPDNVQEFPHRIIADRTSPTNIGMLLLATLTASDLGYLGQRQLLTRMASHIDVLQRLVKYQGHLFNWYSTRDLRPLEPMYVSTVDSGNLVAALIIVAQALAELPQGGHPVARSLDGLRDELEALQRHLWAGREPAADQASGQLTQALDAAHQALEDRANPWITAIAFTDLHCDAIDEAFLQVVEQAPGQWSAGRIAGFRENSQTLRQHIRILLEDLALFAPWLETLAATPAIFRHDDYRPAFEALTAALTNWTSGARWAESLVTARHWAAALDGQLAAQHDAPAAARAWLEHLGAGIERAVNELQAQSDAARRLAGQLDELVEQTDFSFLYDRGRHLFRVGFSATTGEPDSSFYDLLASEARIASLIAIAKGDVPAKHWLHLGRPLTRIRGLRILLSWSATAFEYLMPRLIMHSPASGLINQSCAGAVQEQIRFGKEHAIPWGISESGYAHFDSQGHYQYYAFGIPRLGLKWDQGERLVVSAYSTVLALPFATTETVANLRRLISLGAGGHYGLFEALDFGATHQSRPPAPRVVQSYMAHHQGMILVAIGNAFNQDEMLRRFHSDPRVASVEHLLYERLPSRLQTRPLERLPAPLKQLPRSSAVVATWPVERGAAELALLSNGRLSSRLSEHGGGALYWHGRAATRWDPLAEGPCSGSRIYLEDLEHGTVWRIGDEIPGQPTEVIFAPHTAEFRVRNKDLLIRMTVTVPPSHDLEIRHITLSNNSLQPRQFRLTSYSEPVLGEESADRRHPAFSKLFVEAKPSAAGDLLLFRRRNREPHQPSMFLAHTAIVYADNAVVHGYEIDRGAFLGRNGDPAGPAALVDPSYAFRAARPAADLAEAAGAAEARYSGQTNLDACAAIAVTLDIPPGVTTHCAFLTSVADTEPNALAALDLFRSPERLGWSVEAARMQSERDLTQLGMQSDQVRDTFRLLSRIHWPPQIAHLLPDAFATAHRVQGTLWRQGISGDQPVVTLRVDDEEDLQTAEALLKSFAYADRKGLPFDLVLLDETSGGYTFPLNQRLRKLVETHLAARHPGTSVAAIVPVRNLAAGEGDNLIAAARLFIDSATRIQSALAAGGTGRPALPALVPQPSAPLSQETVAPLAAHQGLLFANRLGGMLPQLDGYSMLLSRTQRTPAPWCNVLANPEFGSLVSESGSMCTWWHNSSEYRLTPWNNDPTLDRTGEAIYIRDEETGQSWSPTPQPRPADAACRVTHRVGETLFELNARGLEHALSVFVDPDEPVKIMRLRLANGWPRIRRLTVTFAAEWVLGNRSGFDRHLLTCERDSATDTLLVRNAFAPNADEECAFLGASRPAHGISCDGREFFGVHRSWANPPGLARIGLSDYVGPSEQPCAIYQVHIELQPGETQSVHFVLGAGANRAEALQRCSRFRADEQVEERYQAMGRHWRSLLQAWQVRTPDIAMDAMLNTWLLYQVAAARLWGRIGFYQASGGFGFRDQLQDVLALLDTQPQAAREQILLSAARQFEEGDVLHWWHERPLRGVRTRCSDDLLWLPFAVAEYVEVTGDIAILDQAVPFLQGAVLEPRELERYSEFQPGPATASVYEHCCRAVDARSTFGPHELPFFGTGDWNDGMNRVGEKGRGESVWMAWFMSIVCRRLAPLCRHVGDPQRAERYQAMAAELCAASNEQAWAGDWYLRGFFDDGSPLGAPGNREAEIDMNAQTWAVLADRQHPRAAQSMQAVERRLLDPEHRLLKLLAPPFNHSHPDPGYIMAYPPGVRENGGQYTHAAAWAVWAAAELGQPDQALRWFDWLNPLSRSAADADVDHYRLEPYVLPGDVYGAGALTGRGGWSWYTGSAAWLYRVGIQQLLGLQRRGDRLFIRPCLPASWPHFEATFRHGDAETRLRIHDPAQFDGDTLFLLRDGEALDAAAISLAPAGRHDYEVFPNEEARSSWLQDQSGHRRHGRPA